MDNKYMIYTTNLETRENITVECADIDDMTNHANLLLSKGFKEVRLVISD